MSIYGFQDDVGKVGAEMSVVSAVIGGGVAILIGVGLVVLAFVPLKTSGKLPKEICKTSDDCPSLKNCVNGLCNCQNDAECPDHSCVDGFCETSGSGPPKRNWWLSLIGFFLIVAALVGIWYAFWWRNLVQHNKAAAQIGAIGLETGVAANTIATFRKAF